MRTKCARMAIQPSCLHATNFQKGWTPMNNFEFELHGRIYKRVPKNIARKIYDAGHPVLFCPCNLNPASPWRPGVTFDNTCKESFEDAAILAEVSNCYDAETGRYLAYYVDTDAMAKVLAPKENPNAATDTAGEA